MSDAFEKSNPLSRLTRIHRVSHQSLPHIIACLHKLDLLQALLPPSEKPKTEFYNLPRAKFCGLGVTWSLSKRLGKSKEVPVNLKCFQICWTSLLILLLTTIGYWLNTLKFGRQILTVFVHAGRRHKKTARFFENLFLTPVIRNIRAEVPVLDMSDNAKRTDAPNLDLDVRYPPELVTCDCRRSASVSGPCHHGNYNIMEATVTRPSFCFPLFP